VNKTLPAPGVSEKLTAAAGILPAHLRDLADLRRSIEELPAAAELAAAIDAAEIAGLDLAEKIARFRVALQREGHRL
jgi:hypothetical protein